jgi:hypothetical protein
METGQETSVQRSNRFKAILFSFNYCAIVYAILFEPKSILNDKDFKLNLLMHKKQPYLTRNETEKYILN